MLNGRRLRRLIDENKKNDDKLCQMRKRVAALESDLKRRMDVEKSGRPDVDGVVLRELDKPLDYEVETAEEFQKKMSHVRHLMAELLVRTSLNELAAQQEMAEQEKEVMLRIRDASNARKMLRDVLLESKKKAEEAMVERKNRYEELQRLECQYEMCSAGAWLAITERNRLSDRLAILTKQPQLTTCEGVYSCDGQDMMIEKTEHSTTKTSQSSSHPLCDGSTVTEMSEKQSSVGTNEPMKSENQSKSCAQKDKEHVVPLNIMTTIQKALHDSLGLDVEFD